MIVLTMSCSKVSLEIGPSIVLCFLLVPSATGAHEIVCGKDLGAAHIDMMTMANCDTSCLRKVSTILDLLEEGLHWLLRVPSLAHLFEFFSKSTAVMFP
jgi:hypothetical protein